MVLTRPCCVNSCSRGDIQTQALCLIPSPSERLSLAWCASLSRAISRLVVLYTGAHPIHGLALLRTLVHHGWRRRSSRARIPVSSGSRMGWDSRRHELRMGTWIHHLGSMRSRDELRLHHHRSHLAGLGMTVVRGVGEASILPHLRVTRSHVYWLVVGHLARRVHAGVRHRHLTHPRGCIGLLRVGRNHAVVVTAILGMRGMVSIVHLHRRHVRRLSLSHIVRSVLQVEGKLMLMGQVWDRIRRVWSGCRRACKGVSLEIFLVSQVHGGFRFFIILQLTPGRERVVRWSQPTIVIPFSALWRRNGFDVSENVALVDVDSLCLAANKLTSRGSIRHVVDSRSWARTSARLAVGVEGCSVWTWSKLMAVGVQFCAHVAGKTTVASVEVGISIVGRSSWWRASILAVGSMRRGLRVLLLLNISKSLSKCTSLLLRGMLRSAAVVAVVLILLLRILLSGSSVAVGSMASLGVWSSISASASAVAGCWSCSLVNWFALRIFTCGCFVFWGRVGLSLGHVLGVFDGFRLDLLLFGRILCNDRNQIRWYWGG